LRQPDGTEILSSLDFDRPGADGKSYSEVELGVSYRMRDSKIGPVAGWYVCRADNRRHHLELCSMWPADQ
jgi:hypothetical protein